MHTVNSTGGVYTNSTLKHHLIIDTSIFDFKKIIDVLNHFSVDSCGSNQTNFRFTIPDRRLYTGDQTDKYIRDMIGDIITKGPCNHKT
jgi:hypothetical protein